MLTCQTCNTMTDVIAHQTRDRDTVKVCLECANDYVKVGA